MGKMIFLIGNTYALEYRLPSILMSRLLASCIGVFFDSLFHQTGSLRSSCLVLDVLMSIDESVNVTWSDVSPTHISISTHLLGILICLYSSFPSKLCP